LACRAAPDRLEVFDPSGICRSNTCDLSLYH